MGSKRAILRIHFDGLCEPNPGGIATYGFVLEPPQGKPLEGSGRAAEPGSPQATNNVAEYTGLVRALQKALELGLGRADLQVLGDSKLVIEQLAGRWRVRDKKLAPLYLEARRLADQFRSARFDWVPREQNHDADRLSYQAYVRELAARR
jgi:ribonuclease HI